MLNLGEFHECGAGFVVVRHAVDPGAHGIAPHQPGIIGPEEFGRRSYFVMPGSYAAFACVPFISHSA